MNSHQVDNISGLALNYGQFIPGVGLFGASLAPAMSDDAFRTGEDYLRLTGAPWKGEHWDVAGGDFHLPSQLLPVHFSNLYFPDIAARGISVEAKHAGRTVGFFYGAGTITNTPRVVLRIAVPQDILGFYVRQQIGSRLQVGLRFMHYSNNLTALQDMPNLLTESTRFKTASSVSLDGLYRLAGPLKFYGEAEWSSRQQEGPGQDTRNVPVSTLAGPIFDSRWLQFRANYTEQSASYLPLLGYYLGDRKGPYAEATVHPLAWVDLYGSASQYENNVGRNPELAGFRNSTASVGATVRLPWRLSLNGQATVLDLWSRSTSANPWDKTASRQQTAAISRNFAHNSFFITVRDFQQVSALTPQEASSAEVEDIYRAKHFLIGGGVRTQRQLEGASRTTLFYHGMAQLNLGRFSAYADVEIGDDLVNKTLLATNTINSSTIGTTVALGKNWEIQGEAYRNTLVAELNPQSIFVLQGQGVFVPGSLADLNEWSAYIRLTRKLRWGKAGDAADLGQYALAKAPLKGRIEGLVRQRSDEGNPPAEGIVVSLDRIRTATTGADGRFEFPEVPEGIHTVRLSADELLADFDPGPNKEQTVAVRPDRPVRSELDVIPLVAIPGKVIGPPGMPLDSIVIRLAPADRYTTPDVEGTFNFYNLHEGEYTATVDEKTLPESAALAGPGSAVTKAIPGVAPETLTFRVEARQSEKPVRKIFDEKDTAPPPQPLATTKSKAADAPEAGYAPTQRPTAPAAVAADAPPPVLMPTAPVAAPQKAAPRSPAPSTPTQRAAAPSRPATSSESALRSDLVKGRQLMQAKRYPEAITELSEAIRLKPGYAAAYNARGYVRYLMHDYAAAIKDLSEAIRLNPNHANNYRIRSLARKAAGDPAGSAADAQRAKALAR